MAYSTLKTYRPLRRVNEERKAKRDEQRFGPGGPGGDFPTVIRALPCGTCGKGRLISLPSWEDLERLRLSQQSECSHVEHGRLAPWWVIVPQCTNCHTAGPYAVHGLNSPGWGISKEPALLYAASLAWAAVDVGLVPPELAPDCPRPPTPADEHPIDYYRHLLLISWKERCALLREETKGA